MQSALELQLWAPGREILARCFGWRHRPHLKASAPLPGDCVALVCSLPATAIELVPTVGRCKGTSSLFKPPSPVPKVSQQGQFYVLSLASPSSYTGPVHQLFIRSVFPAALLQKYRYLDKSLEFHDQKNVRLSSQADAGRSDINDPLTQMKIGGSCL